MNSFLELAALLKMIFHWRIFQGFCLKVSEDFFYRTIPRIFVQKVVQGLFKIILNYVNNMINN